jgi:hypothetical protein
MRKGAERRPCYAAFEYNHSEVQATGVVSMSQAMMRGTPTFQKPQRLSGAPKIAQLT